MKIIYDFGSNNGDNIPYFLKKGDIVIAVEANPNLVEQINKRFNKEIIDGRLVVLNCVLTNDESAKEVAFYIHKTHHMWSQFPLPSNSSDFEKVVLPARRASEILKSYGSPFYVKIDIESYDQAILEDIFSQHLKNCW